MLKKWRTNNSEVHMQLLFIDKKTQTNKPKLNLEGFLMNHFLLLEMQEYIINSDKHEFNVICALRY